MVNTNFYVFAIYENSRYKFGEEDNALIINN